MKKVQIVLIVNRALGSVSKDLEGLVRKLSVETEIDLQQKNMLVERAGILWNVFEA